MTDKGQAYRPSFLLIFALLFTVGAVSSAGATAAMTKLGLSQHGIVSYAFLRLLCFLYLWVSACALILVQTLSIWVSQEGIRARTFWGRARCLAWEDMSAIRLCGMPPLRFVRLFPKDGRAPLWVPWFIKRKGRFREDVFTRVSPDHPLRSLLAREGG